MLYLTPWAGQGVLPSPLLWHRNPPEAERHLMIEEESSLGKGGHATFALILSREGVTQRLEG